MEDSQKSGDPIVTISDTLSHLSVSTKPDIKYKPMPDPLSVYVPLDSLTEDTINSIVSTVQYSDKKDWNHSKRTLLAFLLAINNRISEIEKTEDANKKFDKQTIQHAAQVRQWLVEKDQSDNVKNLNWDELRANYEQMASEKEDGMAKYFHIEKSEPYYELTIEGLHPDVIQSREYMTRFRSHGWEPKELKIYWNAQQLENLCPKPGANANHSEEKKDINNETTLGAENKTKQETKLDTNDETKDETKQKIKDDDKPDAKNEAKDENLPPHDPSDADVVLALRQNPVSKRNHDGTIIYVNKGIEKAVFDAPEDVQLIVLNFANERSPGGGYLRHAWAQEEIILFNSDGYRSLLDLKYGRMGAGYAIPEFGLAYVRDIRFFDAETGKDRKADMLVSACYCVSGSPQLFDNPKTEQEWITKNVAKFRAFMAAAVANTIGDGSNTYLLLGPIGTGAFGNDVTQIGYVFREVLLSTMMGSNGSITKAFKNIWFVSTDKWKNELFEKILNENDMPEVE